MPRRSPTPSPSSEILQLIRVPAFDRMPLRVALKHCATRGTRDAWRKNSRGSPGLRRGNGDRLPGMCDLSPPSLRSRPGEREGRRGQPREGRTVWPWSALQAAGQAGKIGWLYICQTKHLDTSSESHTLLSVSGIEQD